MRFAGEEQCSRRHPPNHAGPGDRLTDGGDPGTFSHLGAFSMTELVSLVSRLRDCQRSDNTRARLDLPALEAKVDQAIAWCLRHQISLSVPSDEALSENLEPVEVLPAEASTEGDAGKW
jgi:hypothetical protein